MKYLVFTLSMPHAASWNGRWSGEGRKYVRARSFTEEQFKKLPDIANKDFGYRWDDGWVACVRVELVDSAKEKNKLVKGSVGFYGYDWMIKSILQHGKILRG